MTNSVSTNPTAPARTHAEAAALFRRPFAPGAIGFRAMTKVTYNGQPYAGAQVAASIGAQSVIQADRDPPGRGGRPRRRGRLRGPRRDGSRFVCGAEGAVL